MPLVTETNAEYHANPAWSKSKLWRYATLTPYRAKEGKTIEKDYFLFGQAGHIAVLEPDLLSSSVWKMKSKTRGTKEWNAEAKEHEGVILLKGDEYELLMKCADVVRNHPRVKELMVGETILETSCYARDDENETDIRCRPDLFNVELGGMLDLKFLGDIGNEAWSKDIGVYGYATQEMMYRDVWNRGSGYKSDFMVFACVSKTEPPEIICRDLEDIDLEEGYLAYRSALKIASDCERNQSWPGQPLDVIGGIKMRDRDRRHTPAQWKIDREALDGLDAD